MERLLAPRDLRRRVVHHPFRRLQPPSPNPVAPTLALGSAVLVVVPSQGVAALRLQRLLYDQTRRYLHQLAPPVRSRQPSSERDLRVRIDPGSSLRHGVPPCWRRPLPAPVGESSTRMYPLPISSKFRTSPAVGARGCYRCRDRHHIGDYGDRRGVLDCRIANDSRLQRDMCVSPPFNHHPRRFDTMWPV